MVFLVFFYVYPMLFSFRSLLFLLLLFSTNLRAQEQTLRVAIASSLMPAMEEIKAVFEESFPIDIELVPGASGTLASQIIHGAPFDLFISANDKYSRILQDQNLLIEPPRKFVEGVLVLWSDLPINNWESENYDELKKLLLTPKVKTIAIAQPDLAPYGDAAQTFLDELNILDQIRHKLIYGNNISLTNQYIYTRSTNLAITSLTSKGRLSNSTPQYWYTIPSGSNLTHTICRLKSNQSLSRKFQEFLFQPSCLSILERYGYKPIVQ